MIVMFGLSGAPNRDADFSNKASNFVEHGQKLAETASLVANFGASTADKQLLDQINATGQEVGETNYFGLLTSVMKL